MTDSVTQVEAAPEEETPLTHGVPELIHLIKAQVPIIWVVTHEETRFIDELHRVFTKQPELKKELFVWSVTQGITTPDTFRELERAEGTFAETDSPPKCLSFIFQTNKLGENKTGKVFILRDFHITLNDMIARRLKDMYDMLATEMKTIIIVSPELRYTGGSGIHPLLEKQVVVVDFALPTPVQIKSRVTTIVTNADKGAKKVKKNKKTTDEQLTDKSVQSLQGLTLNEVDNAVAACLTAKEALDPEILLKEKKQIIRKSGILEFIDTRVELDDIGGLDQVKTYLARYGQAFQQSARDFGVDPLRGLFLTGVPGTGKSYTAKAIGYAWNLPLLKLDIGRVMDRLVGGSEDKMRQVIATAEAVAPAILWLDEVEKSLAGTKSSNFSVSGQEKIWYQEDNTINYCSMRQFHTLVSDNPKLNLKVLALNPDSMKLEWKKVIRSIEHYDKRELIKVKTSSGRTVVASQDHSFITMDQDAKIIKCLTKDLIGKLVPVAKNISIENTINSISLEKYNTKRTIDKVTSFPLNKKSGHLIGLWLAEGSVSGDTVQFAASNQFIRDFIIESVNELWPDKHITEAENSILISSRPLSDWIRENFIRGATEKEIPSFVFSSSNDFRLGVLEGALAGDGSANKTNSNSLDVTLSSGSPSLLDGYGLLMNSLSIGYSRKSYSGKNSGYLSDLGGELRVNNTDLSKLKTIPCNYKQKAISEFKPGSLQTHRPNDRIPLPLNTVYKLNLDRHNPKHEILRTKAHRGQLSATKVLEYLETVPSNEAKKRLESLAYSDVRWDIVQSLDYVTAEESIYDIEVEDNHTFMLANGIVVHNTDGGTTARVFGTLLTAMQEGLKGVTIVATANDISLIPPEFIRRFNDVFFVDLPGPDERWDIFRIHLQKKKRSIDLVAAHREELLKLSEGFTGAEIEKSVQDCIARAFYAGAKEVNGNHLMESLLETKPISKVYAEKIKKLQEWAKDHARYASSYSENKLKSAVNKPIEDIDLSEIKTPNEKINSAKQKQASANRFENLSNSTEEE